MKTDRFDRLPPTSEGSSDDIAVARDTVIAYFDDRFGIPQAMWTGYSFWRKGAEKVWAYAGDLPSPVRTESLGLAILRTSGDYWKPTTDAAQRFGGHATRNVRVVEEDHARRFLAGETLEVAWDGDWGYLIVSHRVGDRIEPIGIGLYTYGELKSNIPKSRRRDIRERPKES